MASQWHDLKKKTKILMMIMIALLDHRYFLLTMIIVEGDDGDDSDGYFTSQLSVFSCVYPVHTVGLTCTAKVFLLNKEK